MKDLEYTGTEKLIACAIVLAALVGIAMWVFFGYAAMHFIEKFW